MVQKLLKHATESGSSSRYSAAAVPRWLAAIAWPRLVMLAVGDAFVHSLIPFLCLLHEAAAAVELLSRGVLLLGCDLTNTWCVAATAALAAQQSLYWYGFLCCSGSGSVLQLLALLSGCLCCFCACCFQV
jgi:hypothetical protein